MTIFMLSFIVLGTYILSYHHILVRATCKPYSCNRNGYCTGNGEDKFCQCDIGFTSSDKSDCDVRICPKGDDPVTKNQNHRAIALSLTATDKKVKGNAEFSFLGETIILNANPWSLTKEELATTLKQLQNVEEVDVTGGKVDRRGSSTFSITFTSWPTIPHENNIYWHDGNPHLSTFSCESLIEDVSCNIQDIKIPPTSIREYVTCSNHGKCNENTGECECNAGWTGYACDDNSDSMDVEVIASDGPYFSGTVLKLQTRTGDDGSFNFINAIAGRREENVFTLAGDGSVHMGGDLSIESGSAIIKGERGINVEVSSPYYRAIDASSPKGGARLHGSGSKFSSSVLLLAVDRDSASNEFKFVEAKTLLNESLFEVDGNGRVFASGGIHIPLATQNNSLAQINSPMATIGSGGIIMNEGHLKAEKGAGIIIGESGNLTIEDGISTFHGSSTSLPVVVISRNPRLANTEVDSSSPLLLIENKQTKFQEDTPDHLEIKTGEKTVFKVDAAGVAHVSGGISVENGSIDILSGGLNVLSGGMSIQGGIQLKSGSLRIENQEGLEIFGGIESVISSSSNSAFTGKVIDPSYAGIILNIEGPEVLSEPKYKFLQMSSNSKKELFSVASSGEVYTYKGIRSEGDIISEKNLNIHGGASMKKKCIPASDVIKINDIFSIAFLEITDDNCEAKNNIILVGTPLENQLLFVKNSDLQPLSGKDLGDIPPLALVLFIYVNPHGWVDVTATAAHTRDLTGVTKLEAVNDLNIGDNSLASASLIVTSKSKANDLGQIAFFGAGGVLSGDKGIIYNPESETLSSAKISARDFVGDSLDFHGGIISSATLVNITIENLKYLVVENLGIKSEATDSGDESRWKMAILNNRGSLSTTNEVLWDEDKQQLLVSAISSCSPKGLEIEADIDMKFKTIRNAVLEKGTVFKGLRFEDGIISNSILNNVTAQNLNLGDVEVESIAVSDLSKLQNTGSLITIGMGGKLIPSDLLVEYEGELEINKAVRFQKDIDLGNNKILNAQITGGSVKGSDIDIHVRYINADSIGLLDPNGEENLLVIDKDGKFKRGSISLTEDGILESLKVGGLQVKDKALFQDGAEINGNTFIDGSLTVSASVLASGPYVDVSDFRYKKEILPLSSSNSDNKDDPNILQKILKLEGVTYELNHKIAKTATTRAKKSSREIGYIAQDVEALFPYLVHTRSDGFKGLKYARFVPVLTEGFKQLYDQMMEGFKVLQRENDELRRSILVFMEKINDLENKMK